MNPRKWMAALAALSAFFLFVPDSSSVAGGLFFDPKLGVGVTFVGDGRTDTALSIGATLGYAVTDYLAVDISYTRFIPISHEYDTSTNLFGTHLTLSKAFGPITPYFRAGPGGYLVEVPGGENETGVFFDVGGGLSVSPVPFVGLTVGVNYSIISGQPNILEPVLGFGISLF